MTLEPAGASPDPDAIATEDAADQRAGPDPEGGGPRRRATAEPAPEDDGGEDAAGAEDEDRAGGKPDGRERTVPLKTLLEERRASRGKDRTIEAMEARFDQVMRDLRANGAGDRGAAGAAAGDGQAWNNPFDRNEAPLDYALAEIEHLRGVADSYRAREDQTAQQRQQSERIASFEQEVRREVLDAGRQSQEFREVYGQLHQRLVQQYVAVGHDPASANTMAQRYQFGMAFEGRQRGLSAVEVLAGLADAIGIAPTAGNGKAAPDPEAADAMRERGERTARSSLGGATGGGGGQPITLAKLSAMSPDQYKAWMVKEGSRDRLKRLMGG